MAVLAAVAPIALYAMEHVGPSFLLPLEGSGSDDSHSLIPIGVRHLGESFVSRRSHSYLGKNVWGATHA